MQDLAYLVKSMEDTLFGKRFQKLTQGLCEVVLTSAVQFPSGQCPDALNTILTVAMQQLSLRLAEVLSRMPLHLGLLWITPEICMIDLAVWQTCADPSVHSP